MNFFLLLSLLLTFSINNYACDENKRNAKEDELKQQARNYIQKAFNEILSRNDQNAGFFLNRAKQLILENGLEIDDYDIIYQKEAEEFIKKHRS